MATDGDRARLYLAVQQAWLRREAGFADPDQPLAELITRYPHEALADPRPMRLLAWRSLTDPGLAPPDGTAATEDLSSTRRRRRRGELARGIDPATLRLVLLAAVAAPVVFPDAARRLFGLEVSDPAFEKRYGRGLARLIAHLAPHAAA